MNSHHHLINLQMNAIRAGCHQNILWQYLCLIFIAYWKQKSPLNVDSHSKFLVFLFFTVNNWCKSKNLKHLGVPMFLGSGSFDHKSTKLRFLVMERFGKDVDELFISNGRKFEVATVLMLGLRIVSRMLFILSRILGKGIMGETTNIVFIVRQKFMISHTVLL